MNGIFNAFSMPRVAILNFPGVKISPKRILGDFLYVDKEGIPLQMSYFPALYQF